MTNTLTIGKAVKEVISENVRVSIVKWSDNEYNVRTEYNGYPLLYPMWENAEVLDERDLGSSMEVYGYLREARNEHL